MKTNLILLSAAAMFSALVSRAGADAIRAPAWTRVIDSDQGQFSVIMKPKEKKVEVVRVDNGVGTPPYLRLRVLRENDRPLEVHLRTQEPPESPLRYTGLIDSPWNESNLGLELEFSVDKKTWKRLGHTIKSVVP